MELPDGQHTVSTTQCNPAIKAEDTGRLVLGAEAVLVTAEAMVEATDRVLDPSAALAISPRGEVISNLLHCPVAIPERSQQLLSLFD